MKHICDIEYFYNRRSRLHPLYYDEQADTYYCEGISGHVRVVYSHTNDITRYVFVSATRKAWITSKGKPILGDIARVFRSKCPDKITIIKTPGQTGNTGIESN